MFNFAIDVWQDPKYDFEDCTSFNSSTTDVPSYRNQSTDFLCKSIDWFLYGGKSGC